LAKCAKNGRSAARVLHAPTRDTSPDFRDCSKKLGFRAFACQNYLKIRKTGIAKRVIPPQHSHAGEAGAEESMLRRKLRF